MIRHRLSFEMQVDDKLYQAQVPHEGTWEQAVVFANDFARYCANQLQNLQDQAKAKAAAVASLTGEPVLQEAEVVDVA